MIAHLSPFRGGSRLLLRCLATLFVLSMAATKNGWNYQQQDWQLVSRDELVEAMCGEKELGYSLKATTNAGRLQSGIVKRLVGAALKDNPNGGPLFIEHEDNFAAYLVTMGLSEAEVPVFVKQSHDHKQDQLVEYRKGKVIKTLLKGREPLTAMTVRAWWKKGIGLPDDLSYDDTLSIPKVRVINERVINSRILDFGDETVYDEVEGMKAKPISGSLGALFAAFELVGLVPNVVQVRMAVSRDSLLLVSFTTKFLIFKKTSQATVFPDGRMIEGIAEARLDLMEIKKRLEEPLEVDYFPYEERDD